MEVKKLYNKLKKENADDQEWAKLAEMLNVKLPKRKTIRSVCEKEFEMLCKNCYLDHGKMSDFFEKRLCNNCSQLDKFKLVCKSTIKSEYNMKDDDLEDLPYIEVKNPHYRCASQMKLYSLCDVKKKFCKMRECNKNEIEEECEIIKKMKEEDRNIRKQKKDEKIKGRKEDLVHALKEYKLKLRSDSKLCNGYIDGTIKDWTIDEIVRRMCEMKYLYDYCDMDDAFQTAKDDQNEELNAGYFPDEPLFDHAERIALEKHGGGYPNVFPWMVKNK